MSWNEIKSLILKSCGELLEPHGFRLVKSRDCFDKVSPTGRLVVQLTLVASDVGNYSVRIGCGVRNNAIEDMVHRTSSVDKRRQSSTTTINISCDQLWWLNTSAEVAAAIVGLQTYIRDVALPFLQKDYSAQDFASLLNTTDSDGRCPCHGNGIWRCHRGLAAAKFADDARYEELKRQYSDFLRTLSNGLYFPEFERCVRNLDGHVV